MHTFQPYPANLLEIDPFTKIGDEWMAVTAGDREKVNTMTASWGTLGVLWGKPVVSIFIRDSRYTKEFIDKNDTFSLTFFDSGDKENRLALKYFGAVSGRNEDKLASVKMHVDYSPDGTPYIDEGNLVLLCRKMSATKLLPEQFLDGSIDSTWYKDKDYHTMYIAEITQILAR
jgi:flavin reductase (DIM6/NTAB) family NADH-FMN oxidoreductase RutF